MLNEALVLEIKRSLTFNYKGGVIMAITLFCIMSLMLTGITILVMLFRRRIKEQNDEIWDKKCIIFRLSLISSRLMPKYPCMSIIYIGPEINCMKPATHIYAGLEICEEHAQALIKNGACPPPVRFDFEKQRAIIK